MNTLTPIFRALADEARLRILNLLFASGELCVCDLESTLGFTQTKVSRHMGYLKRAGLVEDRKCGKWVMYAIAQPRTREQQMIIANVKAILDSHNEARHDRRKLQRTAAQGTLAASALLPTTSTPKENIWKRSRKR